MGTWPPSLERERIAWAIQDDEPDFLYYGYRYYRPGIGRWLSRDPAKELAFKPAWDEEDPYLAKSLRPSAFALSKVTRGEDDNHYAMLLNDPCDSVDLLGLRCGCGLDITAALTQTRDDMTRRFKALGSRKAKYKACEPYILAADGDIVLHPGAASCGARGWDMNAITWDWADKMRGVNCGACTHTVTIRGKCYNSWEANYFSLGVLGELCGLGYMGTQRVVEMWKCVNPQKWGDDWDSKIAFAEWGYMGIAPPYISAAADKTPKCDRCPETYPRDLDSKWPNASEDQRR